MTIPLFPPMVKHASRPLGLISLLALTCSSAQAGLIVDHFTDDQVVRDEPTTDPNTSVRTGGAFLGTTRTITANRNGVQGATSASSNSVNPSTLVLANSGNATGSVTVQWDGMLDLDFTGDGALGIYLAFASPIDHALTITLEALDGLQASTATQTFPNLSQGGGFFFPFLTFSNGGAGVFASVNTFTATFTSTVANWDAGIDDIETTEVVPVPVPGVLTLMALGLTGLRVTRRARR